MKYHWQAQIVEAAARGSRRALHIEGLAALDLRILMPKLQTLELLQSRKRF